MCTSERWSLLADINLSLLPLRLVLEFRNWISPSLRQLPVFLCLPATQLHSSRSFVLQQQPFAILSSNNDSFPLPPSVSIPLFHCLFTSLHQSVQHHSFPSLVLATGNNSLSSLSSSPPSPYLSGYIGSSVRCLGLRQPVSYFKCFLALASVCLSACTLSVPRSLLLGQTTSLGKWTVWWISAHWC